MSFGRDYPEDYTTVTILFTTHDSNGAPVAPLTGYEAADVTIYKNGATAKATTNGITMTSPLNSKTGLHAVIIDTSNDTGDSGYWTTGGGSHYAVVLDADTETVNGQTARKVIGDFTIGVSPVNWGRVSAPTTTVGLTGTTIATTQKVDIETIKTNPVVNGGTITFPTTATLASTTNITAGTVTTATNVTTVNGLAAGVITASSIAADAITAAKIADGAIDAATFAASAINAAAIAADAITAAKIADGAIDAATFAAGAINAAAIAADAITDAKVASDVTIASVTGAVGSVTGAVGSVTGNVGGNVTGSVGSITTGGITTASFAAGAINAAAIATDAITAAKIAADAIGASELAADAVTEIQTGLSTLTAANIRSAVGLASANLDTQLAAVQADTDDIQTRLPAALVSGRIDASVGAMASAVLTATAIAADAITDAKVASDVTIASVTGAVGSVTGNVGGTVASVVGAVGSVTGNVGGNVTGTIGGLTAAALKKFFDTDSTTTYASAVSGSVVKEIVSNSGGTPPTAADIADAVWDEARSGHVTSGTFGQGVASVTGAVGSVGSGGITTASFAAGAIDAAAIATDAIGASELAASAVTEIQAGLSIDAASIRAALGMASANLDTQLSTIDDFLDTEIAAIKAKTDSLTFTVSGQVDANITYVNDIEITGAGIEHSDEWRPA